MAINKPEIPSVELPEDWGGIQTSYTNEQAQEGYPEAVPTVIDGGNLNFEKRGLFQNIKYLRTLVDFLRNLPVGNTIIANSNNQLEYGVTLPNQTDNKGKYLSTDGQNANWVDLDVIPYIESRFKVVKELPVNPDVNVFYYVTE